MTYLSHAGVKGMKWGVRKKRYPEGDSTRKPYTAQQRSNLRKARRNALIAAGVGVAVDAAGVALKKRKGASYAERYLRVSGGIAIVTGLSSAIVQQGRLNADNRLRQAKGA